ncbi:hypothetical protein C8J56DRAFT_1174746 [Mycena floridula]|nr:hypothetical protein C8J56DRAFT_1174746 [Mycena floridula]
MSNRPVEKSSSNSRRQSLMDDRFTVTDSVKPYSVQCAHCLAVVQDLGGMMSPSHYPAYNPRWWRVHRQTCRAIQDVLDVEELKERRRLDIEYFARLEAREKALKEGWATLKMRNISYPAEPPYF